MGANRQFVVGGETFQLQVPENQETFFWNGGKVSVEEFCTSKDYKKDRKIAAGNDLLTARVINATQAGVPQEDYDAVVKERDSALKIVEDNKTSLNKNLADAKAEIKALGSQLATASNSNQLLDDFNAFMSCSTAKAMKELQATINGREKGGNE